MSSSNNAQFAANQRASILAGADEIFNEALNLANLRYQFDNKSLCIEFAKRGPKIEFKALKLAENLYRCISANWNKRVRQKVLSGANWDLRRAGSKRTTQQEVQIERRIIDEFSTEWYNQLPTASGLVCPYERKRSIDLVRKRGELDYELIELKYKSNHPLFAAKEILLYGMLYLHARLELKDKYSIKQLPILSAQSIRLRVLAPSDFYTFPKRGGQRNPYNLAWFEKELNSGIAEFAKQNAQNAPDSPQQPLEMDFQFLRFPDCFKWDKDKKCERADLENFLKNIVPVYQNSNYKLGD
jgi:hypothetical protein